ncbi:MAG TPA: DUF5915 domain-containing protein, partial [Ignavibacteriaceae bacterium]|nr:DUF5915 domain-containing protein [Ignavibacteriaceae bacterium]
SKQESLLKMKDVVLEEVNIKELVVLSDDADFVNKSSKANFKSIGPKFGKKAKAVAEAIKNFNKNQIRLIESDQRINLIIEGEEIIVAKEAVEIISTEITGWVVETESGVTVAIYKELAEYLISEGLAREFVNRIQNMRKDAGFEVTDKIKIVFKGNNTLINAINNFNQYIANETLAEIVSIDDQMNGGYKQDWKIGEYDCSIQIEKVNS